MKIQTKTALLFAMLTAGVILFLSITVYFFTSRYVNNDFLKRLELRAKIASKIYFEENEMATSAFNQLRQEYLTALPLEKVFVLNYDSITGKVTNQHGELNEEGRLRQADRQPVYAYPGNQPELQLPQSFYHTIIEINGKTAYHKTNEAQYAGIFYEHKNNHYLVISSAVNEYGNQALKNLREVLLFTFIGAVIVVFTVGVFFSKKMFEPVRSITHKVKDISGHNLHLRLNAGNGKDEMAELAQTFNNMLDRLETSFETQNNFVSNASHELRTPLTTIIGEAEIALSRSRKEEEYRQTLEVILKQSLRLQHLTHSLLQLAQSGFDGQKQEWGIIRVDELVWTVKRTVDEIEPDNQVKVTMHMPDDELLVSVRGSQQLLNLALSNIVLNACKYSDNKSVLLTMTVSSGRIVIAIIDEGIGIPATELKHIFEPFFRASNTNKYRGYGIGLPLTHTIIRLHKGDINIQSQEAKGTTVIVTLPSVAAL